MITAALHECVGCQLVHKKCVSQYGSVQEAAPALTAAPAGECVILHVH